MRIRLDKLDEALETERVETKSPPKRSVKVRRVQQKHAPQRENILETL